MLFEASDPRASSVLAENTTVDRRSQAYVRWVQRSLNQILGSQLAVDGIMGPKTRGAVRTFQAQRGLAVDGVVGPKTEAALVAAGAEPPPSTGTTPAPSPASGGPACSVRTVAAWINAFIPGSIPGLTRIVPAGPHAGRTMIPGPTFANDCFLTDQRGLQQRSGGHLADALPD